MTDNQTSPGKDRKLAPLKPEQRLPYLLGLERRHSVSGLLAELELDAATLHENKDTRVDFFARVLGEPVCDEGYPLQVEFSAEEMFRSSRRVLETLPSMDPTEIMERIVREELRQAGITKKDMN